jgi:hypothetical protein
MSREEFLMRLPTQSLPVRRDLLASASRLSGTGVQPAQQDVCQNLTGLAQQICYATYYGIAE